MNYPLPAPLVISPRQAAKIVLLSQGIHQQQQLGRGKVATQKAIEKLGYVQIDSICVVQRAHHHCLWNRVTNYQPEHIEQLLADRLIFEYWTHAAAYLPMSDYRFSLPRKNAIARGDKHWFDKDVKLAALVLTRIESEGPLQAKDFEDNRRSNTGWWDWKPAKKALEQLFMEGKLMVIKRQGFQKVYELTERVLPAGVDTRLPSDDEYVQFLISRFLSAQGIATVEQIGYLLKGLKLAIKSRCRNMLQSGQLMRVTVGATTYFALPCLEQLLEIRLSATQVEILSPFDNLLIQRKRTKALFNYDYQIECYVPAQKRKFGYFSLPLLWGQTFAGRMDVKIERKSAQLTINHLHIEVQKDLEFISALKPALKAFMVFNNANQLEVRTISNSRDVYRQDTIQDFRKLLRQ